MYTCSDLDGSGIYPSYNIYVYIYAYKYINIVTCILP